MTFSHMRGGPTLLRGIGLVEPSIRIGLLRLTDAAPVVAAQEKGFFAERGLDVFLSVEPSWANIADKLAYGQLDAAVMLPPLAFAVSLGLRGAGTKLIVPMSLSLNGNSVTLATELAAAVQSEHGANALETGRRLADHLKGRKARPRIAVVHAFSTHNLLLRYWLAAAGVDPDTDIDLTIVPPAEMVDAMRKGEIDGFCAGAPWGEVAARREVGRTIVTSSGIWRNHPEKCLAVSRAWADENPDLLDVLIESLLESARLCDAPENAEEIAEILGDQNYLDLDPSILRASMPGGLGTNVDRSIFFAHATNFPWRSHAAWFLTQMRRWGYLAPDIDLQAVAENVYRPDLFRTVAERSGVPTPSDDSKAEGAHAVAWRAAGYPEDIPMQPDSFCDGRIFGG